MSYVFGQLVVVARALRQSFLSPRALRLRVNEDDQKKLETIERVGASARGARDGVDVASFAQTLPENQSRQSKESACFCGDI